MLRREPVSPRQRSGGNGGPHRRFLIAATIATLALVPGLGSSASAASGGLSYPPTLTKGLPDDSSTGDGVTPGGVPCTASHPSALGGGVDIQGADPDLDLEVKTSEPGTQGIGWRVQGNNNSGSAAQMTIYAICAAGDFRYPEKTVTIAPGHSKAAKVSCPAGRKVVGGGVGTDGGDHSVEVGASEPADGADANHKIDDAWFGIAGNGSTASVTMTVTAVCAKHGTYVVKVGARTAVPDGSSATTTVRCPSGTRVTGGGIDIDGADTHLELHDGFPIDGSDADIFPDDGWQSSAYNDGSGQVHHMKTFAICKQV